MKKFNLAILSILIATVFCFTQCKKETKENTPPTPHVPLNITLYNKPLPVIQSYIQGIWRLEYGKGGFSGGTQYLHDQNILWQFSPGDHIMQNYNGVIHTDTTITWIWGRGAGIGPDSTFIMKFYEKNGAPWIWFVYGIINDSLVLRQTAADGYDYHFSKSN